MEAVILWSLPYTSTVAATLFTEALLCNWCTETGNGFFHQSVISRVLFQYLQHGLCQETGWSNYKSSGQTFMAELVWTQCCHVCTSDCMTAFYFKVLWHRSLCKNGNALQPSETKTVMSTIDLNGWSHIKTSIPLSMDNTASILLSTPRKQSCKSGEKIFSNRQSTTLNHNVPKL